MLVPSRIPPGKHEVVARVRRPESLGGPAEFIYPVEVSNPAYGKPIPDPAYAALKQAHPKARLVSLRRPGPNLKDSLSHPEETLAGGKAEDTHIREGCLKYEDQGGERLLALGSQQGDGKSHWCRPLLRFDLSAIPKDAKLLGAQLRVSLMATNQYGELKDGAAIEAYGLRRGWVECRQGRVSEFPATNWIGPQVYHGGKKADTVWGQPGADDTEQDRFAEPAAAAEVGAFPLKLDPQNKDKQAPREPYRMVALDITQLAARWHSGEIENHGVILILKGSRCVYLASSEFPDYPFRPTLMLAYEGGEPLEVAADPATNLEAARAAAKAAGKPLLIKFVSATCGVCRKVEAITFADEDVKRSLAGFQVVKLAIEEHAALAQAWGVSALPAAVVLARDGTRQEPLDAEVLKSKSRFQESLQAAGAP